VCVLPDKGMFAMIMSSAGLRSEAHEARLQMRETQRKMSELNAVSRQPYHGCLQSLDSHRKHSALKCVLQFYVSDYY